MATPRRRKKKRRKVMRRPKLKAMRRMLRAMKTPLMSLPQPRRALSLLRRLLLLLRPQSPRRLQLVVTTNTYEATRLSYSNSFLLLHISFNTLNYFWVLLLGSVTIS
jgi:hypothetical protein